MVHIGWGERRMEFHFGSQVQRNDGERLGELTRVVYEGDNRTIDFLVAQSVHMGERELKIPLETIQTTDDETVQVDLTGDEFEALEEYSSSHNVAPPPDRDFADIDGEDELAPGSETPPVGAATGIESIAFTPIVEESVYIPSGDGVIDRSTEVWATDGLVGNVRGVTIDDTSRRMRELLVKHGTIFTHESVVPAQYIESMRTDAIVLTVERAAVDHHDAD
jgi:uncharacterized protein YrrD